MSAKPNPMMESSEGETRPGHRWVKHIGWIPEEWEIRKIGELIQSLLYGPRFSASLYNEEGNVRVIRGTDVTSEGEILYENAPKALLDEKIIKSHRLINNDLVVVTTADCGLPTVFTEQEEEFIASAYMVRYRLNSKTLPRYLHRAFFLDRIYNNIQSYVRRATVPNLPGSDLLKIEIPLPPLSEQVEIDKILSKFEDLISKVESLIPIKAEQKRGLMQQLLTGKTRFPEFEAVEVSFLKLKGFLTECKEKNKDDAISRVLSVTNKEGFIEQTDQFDRVIASKDLSNYKIVRKGDFGYNPSRVNVGSVDLLESFDMGLLSPMYVVFKTDENSLLSPYLKQHFKTHHFFEQVKRYTQGSVRDSLSFDSLCQIKFFIPSNEEQAKITSVLTTADHEITLLHQKLAALKLQKKGLMQKLLTGEVRVNA